MAPLEDVDEFLRDCGEREEIHADQAGPDNLVETSAISAASEASEHARH